MHNTLMIATFIISGMMIDQAAAGVDNSPVTENVAAAAAPQRLYRHVVLFKFKEEATKEQVAEIVAAFGELEQKIPTIVGYEHGTDVSPEKLAKGFTHCFMVTFKSKDDLEAYLPHEAHQEFVKKLKPILSDVLVVDYWTNS